MKNREQFESVLKLMRRLNDDEIEQIGSMVAKKIKSKSEAETGLKVVAVDFEAFVTNNSVWKGAVTIIGEPVSHFFDELKKAVEDGYEIVAVTPRVKYEGGEEAVLAWFRNNNCPPSIYNKLHISSCIPFGVAFLSTPGRIRTSFITQSCINTVV